MQDCRRSQPSQLCSLGQLGSGLMIVRVDQASQDQKASLKSHSKRSELMRVSWCKSVFFFFFFTILDPGEESITLIFVIFILFQV